MPRPLIAITTAALAIAVGGCVTSGSTPVNTGLASIKTPVVTQSQVSHTIRFDGTRFAAGEEAALATFFRLAGIGYGDRLRLEDSSPEGAAERYAAVTTVVGRFGLPLQPRSANVAASQTPAGQARLVVVRATAEVAGCPDWSRGQNPNWRNETTSNHGCATNANLAAMVADKNELLDARTLDNQNAGAIAKPVAAFDGKKVEGLEQSWTGTGPQPTGGPR
jgi:pilus assembly protein CpaD